MRKNASNLLTMATKNRLLMATTNYGVACTKTTNYLVTKYKQILHYDCNL